MAGEGLKEFRRRLLIDFPDRRPLLPFFVDDTVVIVVGLRIDDQPHPALGVQPEGIHVGNDGVDREPPFFGLDHPEVDRIVGRRVKRHRGMAHRAQFRGIRGSESGKELFEAVDPVARRPLRDDPAGHHQKGGENKGLFWDPILGTASSNRPLDSYARPRDEQRQEDEITAKI